MTRWPPVSQAAGAEKLARYLDGQAALRAGVASEPAPSRHEERGRTDVASVAVAAERLAPEREERTERSEAADASTTAALAARLTSARDTAQAKVVVTAVPAVTRDTAHAKVVVTAVTAVTSITAVTVVTVVPAVIRDAAHAKVVAD